MEKRTFWPFEVDHNISKMIYERRFYGKPKEDPILHLKKFNERCKVINLNHANVNMIKVKLFPYSLARKALDWILRWPLETLALGLI